MEAKERIPHLTKWESRPDAHTLVPLSPEIHADMEFWRCACCLTSNQDATLTILPRPPVHTIYSDASATTVAGYSVDIGRW